MWFLFVPTARRGVIAPVLPTPRNLEPKPGPQRPDPPREESDNHVRINTLIPRLVAGVAVLAVAGPGVLVSGVANAQPPVGAWTPSPSTGSDTTPISGVTNGTCDVPGTAEQPVDGYNAVVLGPGGFGPLPDAPDGVNIVSTSDINFSTTDPISFVHRTNFQNLADELGTQLLPGDYVVTFRCVNQFEGTVFQTFKATFTFTGGPPATEYTVTDPVAGSPTPVPVTPTPTPVAGSPTPTPRPGGEETTSTRLQVFPNPAFQGLPVVLIARVSPFAAEGTVQFKDGTANIGNPVPVFGGFAIQLTWGLERGSHLLTAVFTPTDPADFGPSTSEVEMLTVRSLFGFLEFLW